MSRVMLFEELFSSMKERHQRSVEKSKAEQDAKGVAMTRRLHELLDPEKLIPSAVRSPKNGSLEDVKHND
jgi:hypothetical protein